MNRTEAIQYANDILECLAAVHPHGLVFQQRDCAQLTECLRALSCVETGRAPGDAPTQGLPPPTGSVSYQLERLAHGGISGLAYEPADREAVEKLVVDFKVAFPGVLTGRTAPPSVGLPRDERCTRSGFCGRPRNHDGDCGPFGG